MKSLCAVVGLLCLTVGSVSAQSWESLRNLQPGAAVRVTESGGHHQSGRWKSATDTAALIETGKGEVSIDKTQIDRIEAQRPGRRLRNAAIGAAIGLGIGIIIDQTLGTRLRNESAGDSVRALSYTIPTAALAGIGATMPGWHTVYRVR